MGDVSVSREDEAPLGVLDTLPQEDGDPRLQVLHELQQQPPPLGQLPLRHVDIRLGGGGEI